MFSQHSYVELAAQQITSKALFNNTMYVKRGKQSNVGNLTFWAWFCDLAQWLCGWTEAGLMRFVDGTVKRHHQDLVTPIWDHLLNWWSTSKVAHPQGPVSSSVTSYQSFIHISINLEKIAIFLVQSGQHGQWPKAPNLFFLQENRCVMIASPYYMYFPMFASLTSLIIMDNIYIHLIRL